MQFARWVTLKASSQPDRVGGEAEGYSSREGMREGRMVTGNQAVLRTSCVSFTPSCAHLAFNRYLCQLIQNEPVSGDKAGLEGLLLETISKAFAVLLSLCGREVHCVAEINTDKHAGFGVIGVFQHF